MKKKVLKRMFLNTLALYPTIYLITCYVKWELVHPFQWALDMPTSELYRKNILAAYVCYVIFNALISAVYIENKNSK